MNRENVEVMMHYFRKGGRPDAGFDMDSWMGRPDKGVKVCGCIAMHAVLNMVSCSPERLWDRLPDGPSGGAYMIDMARGYLGLDAMDAQNLFQGYAAHECRGYRKVTMDDAADMMQLMLLTGKVDWTKLRSFQFDKQHARDREVQAAYGVPFTSPMETLRALLHVDPNEPPEDDEIGEPEEEPDSEDDLEDRLVTA